MSAPRRGELETSGVRGVVRAVSVAPMMKCTDRHFRRLMRLISEHTLLYTEMVTCGAVIHGDRERLLGFDEAEHPIALQLGGDDPEQMAECARIGEGWGYDEVNINVGCPSERVQSGNFGACLMAEPERVAACVEAMRRAVKIPVTVKHRIGIDEIDRYEDMERFVGIVREAGADRFTVHARKAWLKGLSPKENRNVPPLRHEEVWRLKEVFPELIVETNGGIGSLEEVAHHLEHVDAVMIGRWAYDDPYGFAGVDARFFGDEARRVPGRHEVARAMIEHTERWLQAGGSLAHVTRHMLQLFRGQPGARSWRRHLTEEGCRAGAGPEVIEEALALVPE